MVRCPPLCGSPTPSRPLRAGERLLPPARGGGGEGGRAVTAAPDRSYSEDRFPSQGETLYLSPRECLLPLVGFGINGGGISEDSS